MTPDAIERLVKTHANALVLYARQWCHCPDDAVQQAFFELSQLSESPKDPIAWLFVVSKRRAVNIGRSEQRRRNYQTDYAEQRPMFESSMSATHGFCDLELTEALESLTGRDREVIIQRVWGNLTLQQISEIQNVSIATIHRRYESALNQLRSLLGIAEQNTLPHPKENRHSPNQLDSECQR